MFRVPNHHRVLLGPYASSNTDGNNGVFMIKLPTGAMAMAIASDGLGWEHVSVSIPREERCPTWEEMCAVKRIFWEEEDTVVQYHPPRSQYVNRHLYCLHLWRPTGTNLPTPPTILIG